MVHIELSGFRGLRITHFYNIKCMILVAFFGLAGCSAPIDNDASDPFEAVNREVHRFNLALDRNFVRPVALTYVSIVNPDIQNVFSNMADNLSTPNDVANNILQGDLESGVKNSLKFIINTTFGLAGLANPAEKFGIIGETGDFGQTLHVWGVAEGPFVVLPGFGPSTGRDALGVLGDLSLDPLGPVMSEQAQLYSYGIHIANVLSKRGNYSASLDSIFYDSTDSYEQMKLIYLQARRFELDGTLEDDYFDPYEENFE